MLAGLLPHTTYHYRLRATQADGSGYVTGTGLTFTTANHTPEAADDNLSALPSAPILLDVLANDTDADGDALSIASFTQPGAAAGTVSRAGTKLKFTPSATFNGGLFTYVAADAFGGKSVATPVFLHRDSSFTCPAALSAASDQATAILSPIVSAAPFTVTGAPSWLRFQPIQALDQQVIFELSPNPSVSARTATIKVGGQAVVVTQAGASAPPVLSLPNTIPNAAISGWYDLAVPTQNGPVTYSAKGLPPGLSLSNTTGHITGFAATAKTYSVSVMARNTRGVSNQIHFPLTVLPFSGSLAGGWSAIIERNAVVNDGLGGLVVLNVAAGGAVTGTVKNGTATQAFTGRLNTAADAYSPDPDHPQLRVALPHSGLVLLLRFNDNFDRNLDGTLTLGGDTAGLSGSQYLASQPDNDIAADFVGRYTAALLPTSDDPAIPQGNGILTLRCSTAGIVTWTCQLADGSPPAIGTCSLTALYGAPLHAVLYGGRGSVLGPVILPTIKPGVPGDNELVGYLSWSKKPDSARAYGGGFGQQTPVDLFIEGGGYTPPGKSTAILPGAMISFAGSGIETTSMGPHLTQVVSISASNVATLPATKPGNPANIRITAIDPANGTFTGSLVLVDPNPFSAQLPPVSRTVGFKGVFLQGVNNGGTGYFLLPSTSGPPVNVTTSPMFSGQVNLTPQ